MFCPGHSVGLKKLCGFRSFAWAADPRTCWRSARNDVICAAVSVFFPVRIVAGKEDGGVLHVAIGGAVGGAPVPEAAPFVHGTIGHDDEVVGDVRHPLLLHRVALLLPHPGLGIAV